MRALVCKQYGPPEDLVIETVADPEPGHGEILVDVRAAGLNFPDVLSIAGKYQVKTPTPFVPGNEASGVVSATGNDVTRFSVGDDVIVTIDNGAFAEKCIAQEARAIPLLPGLTFEQGAGFTLTYSTSYHALKQSTQLAEGETVLVLGAAGGVGVTATEIAKAFGARVIAAASSDAKLEFAKSIGADELLNYSDKPLKETVREMTDGRGADVVYDPVGGELAIQALRATAWHGRYLVIGFASGTIPQFPANLALLKEASIIGVYWGSWAAQNPQQQAANISEMAALIAAGKLTPRVTESYAFDDFLGAFGAITGRRALGKVILRMD